MEPARIHHRRLSASGRAEAGERDWRRFCDRLGEMQSALEELLSQFRLLEWKMKLLTFQLQPPLAKRALLFALGPDAPRHLGGVRVPGPSGRSARGGSKTDSKR